jgi:hypothetical protein
MFLTRIWTLILFGWKYLVGVWFCCGLFLAAAAPDETVARVVIRMILAPLVSVVVVGWTYRLMQRRVLLSWWKKAPEEHRGESFARFADDHATTAGLARWPGWFLPPNRRDGAPGIPPVGVRQADGVLGRLWRTVTAPFRGLWRNVRIGTQAVFNTWVLTGPACLLWVFSWHAGWNNSFHKNYEHWWVGPLSGWLGIGIFIAAMMYVPMAQARQAATGEWRRFYEFRLVRGLIRRRALSCLGLAALYTLAAVPVTVFRILPGVAEQTGLAVFQDRETPAEMIQALNQYTFSVSLVLFPLFVGLHLVAARIYASAIREAVREGTLPADRLGEFERETLARLELLEPVSPQPRPLVVRGLRRVSGWGLRLATGTLAVVVWFLFVFQIYFAEFFNYHPFLGWMNQPLVHLPWLHYVPLHLP